MDLTYILIEFSFAISARQHCVISVAATALHLRNKRCKICLLYVKHVIEMLMLTDTARALHLFPLVASACIGAQTVQRRVLVTNMYHLQIQWCCSLRCDY